MAPTTTTTRPPTPGELAYAKAAEVYARIEKGPSEYGNVDSCRTVYVRKTGTNPGTYTLDDPVIFDVGPGPDFYGGWVDTDSAVNNKEPVIIGHNATIIFDERRSPSEFNFYCGVWRKLLTYDQENTRINGTAWGGQPGQLVETKLVGVAVKKA